MSLSIDTKYVKAVLLLDGKWHHVAEASFDFGTYEFQRGSTLVLGGGGASGVSEVGACWIDVEEGARYGCPLSSIVAVKYKG